MKKAYIQPEIELLKVSAIGDFLDLSTENKADDDWNGDDNGYANTDEWA